MNEYEARLRSVAATINSMRATSGTTASTLMFAFLSLMLSKNKITERDVEIIFDVERGQAKQTLKSYFEKNYGDASFELQNPKEMEDTEKFVVEYIDSVRDNVKNAALQIKTPRQKKAAASEEKI